MNLHRPCLVLLVVITAVASAAQQNEARFHTHNDRFTVRAYASAADWRERAAYLREHILATAGLLPMPEKAALNAQVFGERHRDNYSVAKVYFESLPGFFVTGNLYRPTGPGPFPAILSPHGHWTYGRLENTDVASGPARAINLARQGFVVFAYDMVGYNDSRQLAHESLGKRASLWGLSLAGLQLWNSIRSIDFLESLAYVDRARIGATGESGGGTQTFLTAAVDERIAVAAPVNMISLHMQGGCVCENPPGLRLDTNNVELAATIAPRPLLMVSATGDWTKETMTVEYPAMQRLYGLLDARDRVRAVQFDAPHNYNKDSREAVYAWMARWLKNAAPDTLVAEKSYRVESAPELLVFYGRPLPEAAVSRDALVEGWITRAKQQLQPSNKAVLQRALLHALALPNTPAAPQTRSNDAAKTVLLAGDDPVLHSALRRAGFKVHPIAATPFDEQAAGATQHFETYNRTAASLRVADIVSASQAHPGASLVAGRGWGLAAVLAAAASPLARIVADVEQFDSASDEAFVHKLYIPGVRRAGDLHTATSLSAATLVMHNSAERHLLTPAEIVALLNRR